MRIRQFYIITAVATLLIGCITINKNQAPPQVSNKLPPAGTMSSTVSSGTSSPTATTRTTPKSFKAFFDSSKLKTQKGLIVVHWQDDKYYFEIPNALLGKDFLTVTRFVRMAAGAYIYGGEEANEKVLRFERGPENKLFLRTTLHIVSSPDSTKPIYQAVKNSNVDPIAAAFDIKAYNQDTTGVVIAIG